MHILDPLLNGRTMLATAALSAGGLGLALRHARLHLPRRSVPLMGLSAAFVFAAQMINFPVGAGTSGHLLGGVLAAVLVGPSAAVVVLTAVLIVQCLMFADGGLLALGANVFNMAIVGAAGGYGIYALVHRLIRGARGQLVAAAVAAWASTVLAAMCCAGELAASGTGRWSLVFPAMTGVHALIGIGEAAITVMVLAAVGRARPELLNPAAPIRTRPLAQAIGYGLLICVGLTIFVAPFASKLPDGLESVTRNVLGVAPAEGVAPMEWTTYGAALAGTVGVLLVFALAWLLAGALLSRRAPSAAVPD